MTVRLSAITSIIVVTAALALAAVATSSATDPAPRTQALTRTCTTDASGYCTVTHSLGVAPEAVVVTPAISAGGLDYHLSVVTGSATATSVRVRAMRTDSAPRANQPITFSLVLHGSAPPPTMTTTPPTVTTTTTSTTITTPPATTTTTSPPPAGCALPAYPDATCTGVPAGTQLTRVDGDQRVDTPNTVLDGKDIRGCVDIRTTGVVIRNTKIICTSIYAVYAHTGASVTIEDSEISCGDTRTTAVGDLNVTLRRVNIHGCENGLDADGNILVEDSYIHDMYSDVVAHTDGIQLTDVANAITIRHNTIYSRTSDGLDGEDGTSSIISPRVSAGVATNVLIEYNMFGGGAYTLYCPQAGPGVNYRVIGNRFSTRWHPTVGFYGPWTDCEDEAEVTGNVYHDGAQADQPVPF